MRLLLTTDTIGGVWTFTRELVIHLLQAGDQVALVSFGRAPSAEQARWVEATRRQHGSAFLFEASDAPLEWMQENVRSFAAGEKVLMQVASRFRPDLLHASQFCWGALRLDIPKLVTAHSDVMSWASAVRPEDFRASAWLARYCALVQSGLDGADAVIAPTHWMRNALLTHFHVPRQVRIIRNGRTVQVPEGAGERKLQAVSAGRLWDKAKGLNTLLEINAAMPVLIAGEEQFEQSQALSHPNVTALGRLDEDALLRVFEESSVYVATSLYEPFGLAPLEAAACGCALVLRDLGSFREIWGDAALYFRDAVELERLLEMIAADREACNALRRAAWRRTAEFTGKRMAEEYAQLYRHLAVKHGSTRRAEEEPVQHAA